MDIQAWVRQALALAKPLANEQVEIFGQRREENSLEWNEGRLENQENVSSFGAAVRVITAGAVGFSYRADLRLESMAEAVMEARAMARQSEADPNRGLPAVMPPAKVQPQEEGADLTLEIKMEAVRRMERAALSADSRVKKVSQSMLRERSEHHALANSLGLEISWSRRAVTLGAAALAEEDHDSQLGEEYRAWKNWQEWEPERVGQAAGERAAGLLGARPIPSGKRRLILPPHITTGLLEAAWEAWSGDAAQRGRSFFAGRTGQMVAAPAITLVDDGTLAQGLASAPVDDEGTTTQRTALLSEGRLAGFLYNAESGRRAGARSTGNGQRNGFKNLPSVGPTNFLLLPGQAQPSDLLAEAEAGLYISELMGLHTLDAVTGEFSLGANGRLITKGVLGQPVRGITIAGTVETLLKQVTAIGADLTWYGSIGAPTLLVSDVMVSGT